MNAITRAMLEEITRLQELVKESYEEGYYDGRGVFYSPVLVDPLCDECWEDSGAKKELDK